MDKQKKWMDFQYHDNNGLSYAFFFFIFIFFAESSGQRPGDFGGENRAGNVKGNKQNFQLSDLLNILVSVTGTCEVLCLLLHSVSHKSLL